MKILINVVNARNVGGGLQVVYNFVRNTLNYPRDNVVWYYAVSECLDLKYLDDQFKEQVKGRYFVYPNQPDFKHSFFKVQKQLRKLENMVEPDVIYTILGPGYFFFKQKEVIRFANAWSTNPNKYAWKTLPINNKIWIKLHNILERSLLRRAKYIITQTKSVKQGLHRVTRLPENRIKVVPNVLPATFLKTNTSNFNTNNSEWIDVAAIGGQMPHKNFEIIPEVLKILDTQFFLKNFRFHTTLPEDSDVWKRIKANLSKYKLEKNVVNHGSVGLTELSDIYGHCVYSFLPSVLETFSASTIEAMYFDLKIVATDLSFNREVLGDTAYYYEPLNPEDAADNFVKLHSNPKLFNFISINMSERITNYIDYKKYYNDTLDFLVEVGSDI